MPGKLVRLVQRQIRRRILSRRTPSNALRPFDPDYAPKEVPLGDASLIQATCLRIRFANPAYVDRLFGAKVSLLVHFKNSIIVRSPYELLSELLLQISTLIYLVSEHFL